MTRYENGSRVGKSRDSDSWLDAPEKNWMRKGRDWNRTRCAHEVESVVEWRQSQVMTVMTGSQRSDCLQRISGINVWKPTGPLHRPVYHRFLRVWKKDAFCARLTQTQVDTPRVCKESVHSLASGSVVQPPPGTYPNHLLLRRGRPGAPKEYMNGGWKGT